MTNFLFKKLTLTLKTQKNRLQLTSLFFIAILGISGCSSIPLIKEPQAQVKDVSLKNLDLKGGNVQLLLEVENPNGIGLKLDDLEYKFFLNDKLLTAAKHPETINIPANGKSPLSIILPFQYSDVFNSVGSLFQKKSVPYRFEGVAKIAIFSLPFKKEGEFKF